jgi:hypothetical protein
MGHQLGCAQPFSTTANAAWYLTLADTTQTFLLKKCELLQKALIILSVVMIWLTSTNYFTVQLAHALGSIIIWRIPLDLNDLQAKYSIKQSAKQNDEINSSKPVSEKAIVILEGWAKRWCY